MVLTAGGGNIALNADGTAQYAGNIQVGGNDR